MFIFMQKAILFLCAIFTFMPVITKAAYIQNISQTLVQPDETILECYASGDEFYNYLHDSNGYTIIKNKQTNWFVYANKSADTLIPTDLIPNIHNPIEYGLTPYILHSQEYIYNRTQTRFKLEEMPNKEQYDNLQGSSPFDTINQIVILVTWSGGQAFYYPLSYYDNLYNGANNSFKAYWLEQSYGQLVVNTHLYEYQSPYSRSSISSGTQCFGAFIRNIINSVASLVPANLNIDKDNNGYIDNISVIIQGKPDGWGDDLWPHSIGNHSYLNGYFNSGWGLGYSTSSCGYAVTNNSNYRFGPIRGKYLNSFNLNFEWGNTQSGSTPPNMLYVLCHEFFHTFGTPDYYVNTGINLVGVWTLMANNGNYLTMYEKWKFGQWIDYIPTISQDGVYSLKHCKLSPDNAYRINCTTASNYFFVIEYRNINNEFYQGGFSYYSQGRGVLIYRVNTNRSGNNYGSNGATNGEMYVYRPGGTTSAAGTIGSALYNNSYSHNGYPRTIINNTTTYLTTPFLENGTQSGININSIQVFQVGDSVTFRVGNVPVLPQITTQPISINLAEGETLTLTITAINTTSYIWQKDGENIPFATTTTYTKTNVSQQDAGAYRCIAINSSGADTSLVANVTIAIPLPMITTHPEDESIIEGNNITLYVNAINTTNYQWQKDGENITGATSNIYTKTNVQLEDAGSYRCIAMNSSGSDTSNIANVTVLPPPPIITTHPASVNLCVGDTLILSIVATGATSYQWQKYYTDIPEAISSTFIISDVQFLDSGYYHCIAKNSTGSVTSNIAYVKVFQPAPVITTHPISVDLIVGDTLTLSIEATGATSYQWQKDYVDIYGATSATYTIPNVDLSDSGNYLCIAINSSGITISDWANVRILPPAPVIITHPISVDLIVGDTLTLSIEATGTTSYQWQKDYVNIFDATSATYILDNVQFSDSGIYRCIAANINDSVISNSANVRVFPLSPVIITHPVSIDLYVGDTLTLSVEVTDATSYQWQKDYVDIYGATSATYIKLDVDFSDSGNYRCIATNISDSAISNSANVKILSPVPVITKHPIPVNLIVGDTLTLSIEATGTTSYQWQKDNVNITDATSATYIKLNVQLSDSGNYRCIATNINDSAISNSANVTVSESISMPVITMHPQSQDLSLGSTLILEVLAIGVDLNYQWKKDGSDIIDAITSIYTQSDITKLDEGIYTCKISNNAGSIISNPAIITITDEIANKIINFSITPNPTSDIFTLSMDILQSGNISINLVNVLGSIQMQLYNSFVESEHFIKMLSLSTIPRGVYYIRIEHSGSIKFEKIILN